MAEGERHALFRSQVNVKTVATVGLVAIGLLIGVVLIVGAKLAWVLVVISAFLSAAANHPVDWLARRIGRPLGITVVMLVWLAACVGLAFLFIPPLVGQVQQLLKQLPRFLAQIRGSELYRELEMRLPISEALRRLLGTGAGGLSGAVQPLLSIVGYVVKGVAGLVSIFFLVLFMLTSGGKLVRSWLKETLPTRRERYAAVLGRIYHAIGGYVLGLIIIMVINALLTSIFLAILGVPFYLPLGLLSGIGSALPLIGAFLAGAIIIIVALATGGIWHGVAALAYYIAYQLFENHVIAPVVYRRTININALVVLVALLVFAELGGVLGAILSVPVVATCQVILKELLAMRRERLHLPPPGEVPPTEVIHRPDDHPPER